MCEGSTDEKDKDDEPATLDIDSEIDSVEFDGEQLEECGAIDFQQMVT